MTDGQQRVSFFVTISHQTNAINFNYFTQKESYMRELVRSFSLQDSIVQKLVNQLTEEPKSATQERLFELDTG
ncbi:hypothetical protein [Enterococcus camelliae]|uniref:Uncharacterized protein n=1 Tax=Enterococcus camelliae TaxID=453959 RepID=A0ABW5TFQ3_9ENTE